MKKKIIIAACGVIVALACYGQQNAKELLLSEEGCVYWYRIVSACQGMDSYGISDCADKGTNIPLQMLQTEDSNKRSQWKFTKNEDGTLCITNRETGNHIACSSVAIDSLCPATQITTDAKGGFEVDQSETNTFTMLSTEDDGIRRYLGMVCSTNDLGNQTSWYLQLQESEISGINDASATDMKVVVSGNRIMVSGCNSWQLFSIDGEEMPRTVALPAGIYIVKTPNKNLKVTLP